MVFLMFIVLWMITQVEYGQKVPIVALRLRKVVNPQSHLIMQGSLASFYQDQEVPTNFDSKTQLIPRMKIPITSVWPLSKGLCQG